ncbi:MAG: hypothetical protein AAGD13_22200 [Pseudomonadota bacterium]
MSFDRKHPIRIDDLDLDAVAAAVSSAAVQQTIFPDIVKAPPPPPAPVPIPYPQADATPRARRSLKA